MTTERRYYDDSYTTQFRAPIVRRGEIEGRAAVELAITYFYPESGGQEADRGTLGPWKVVDVQAAEEGSVWHMVAEGSGDAPASDAGEEFEAGSVIEGRIDWARRFDHMQQHTGQHILSAAFERVIAAPTLSSSLGLERGTIEVAIADVTWRTLERIEEAANAIVWRDLEIARHWVDDEGVKRLTLRKPPKVSGRIRIVEIPEWDVSACGGTHTLRTGEVGVIKIVRWEKVRGNLRFEFLCGARALRDYGWRTETLLEAAKRRTLKDRELIAHLERAAEERDELKKQVKALSDRITTAEAAAAVGDPPRAVVEHRADWPRDTVRTFAVQCIAAGAPWVIAASSGPEPTVIGARSKAGTLDLREVVPALKDASRGKGGGSPDMITIAAADAAGAADAVRVLEGWIQRGWERSVEE